MGSGSEGCSERTMAGQYFWFICLGVWLIGLAVLWGRASVRGATDDQSRRDMNRAFATAVAVVAAVCVPLGVLHVLGGIRDPLCLQILPLTNAYVLASWVAVGLANAGILSWVWLGNGGQVLSVLGQAALRQPVSAVAMRRFVTGAVLWSVLFGVVGRTVIDPMPGYCDGQAGVGASVGGNVAGKQAARAISMRALFCAFLVLGVS